MMSGLLEQNVSVSKPNVISSDGSISLSLDTKGVNIVAGSIKNRTNDITTITIDGIGSNYFVSCIATTGTRFSASVSKSNNSFSVRTFNANASDVKDDFDFIVIYNK